MTKEEIEEDLQIIANRTPGEWTFEAPVAPAGAVDILLAPDKDGNQDSVAEWVVECIDEAGRPRFDATFITKATTRWKAALEEVVRLQDCLAVVDNSQTFRKNKIEQLRELLVAVRKMVPPHRWRASSETRQLEEMLDVELA